MTRQAHLLAARRVVPAVPADLQRYVRNVRVTATSFDVTRDDPVEKFVDGAPAIHRSAHRVSSMETGVAIATPV